MKRHEPKKSETLEVRLPHEVKAALMEKARVEGQSASSVVREFIDAYLADQRKEARTMFHFGWKPVAAAGGAVVLGIWAALVSTPAVAGPDLKAAFEQLDRNQDGSVKLDEFLGRSPDTMFVMKADRPAASGSAKPFVIPLRRELPAPPPGGMVPDAEFLSSEFSRQDLNRDGAVTFSEFEQFHRTLLRAGFAAIDLNQDRWLDRAEFEAAVRAAPGGPAAASFADVDADRDGRISEEEFFS